MEFTDVYDAERVRKGYQKEKFSKLEADEFILIAHIIVFNSRNEMLIQRRAADKKDWPGYWDVSCGGGALSGENSKECAVREMREELGITVSLEEERPYLTVHYPRGFDDYYILELELEPEQLKLQQSELTEIAWATKEEILQMMKEKKFVRYNEGFIEMLFAMKDNRGTYLKYERE